MAYVYFNPNPWRLTTDDCTVRAISCALGLDWDKEALSAFQKACWIIEDNEGESGGEYGAQRRSRRTGRYMMGGGYGWMPGPYYDGGMDRYGLADDLDEMAKHANSEAERTSYREAAHKLRNG